MAGFAYAGRAGYYYIGLGSRRHGCELGYILFGLREKGAYTVKSAHEVGHKEFPPGRITLICGGRLPGTVYPWGLTVHPYRAGPGAGEACRPLRAEPRPTKPSHFGGLSQGTAQQGWTVTGFTRVKPFHILRGIH